MTGKAQPTPDERQAFGLRVPRPSHPELRRLRSEHSPSHQGWRLWSSTWLLLSYLEDIQLEGRRVLDVGCGWGVASVYCARRGARVTAADIDPAVLPLVGFHAELNGVEVEAVEAGFSDVGAGLLADVDWVIGTDICFRADLIDPLFDLVAGARTAGATVALTDPGRPTFLTLATRCVDELGARDLRWQTPEPLVAWPGERPLVHGRLVLVGPAGKGVQASGDSAS